MPSQVSVQTVREKRPVTATFKLQLSTSKFTTHPD
jgi:hypothetical protein